MIIKVADFGLAEDVYTTRYFRMEKDSADSPSLLPLKWTAMEGIHDGMFSEKSDVVSGPPIGNYGMLAILLLSKLFSFSGLLVCYVGKYLVLAELPMVECLTWKLFECLIRERDSQNLTMQLAVKKCQSM